jgi:hypothetical protein
MGRDVINGRMRRWTRLGAVCALLLALTLAPASRAHADGPIFVDWPSLLPGLTSGYDPSSENACVAGRPQCVDAVIREMERRFESLGKSCDHNAVFALAYLRTTQTYQWASEQDGFFEDTPWVNHEDAVFARHYFEAYDHWAAGRRSQTPRAWLIAFDAAAARRVSASGNLLLGMSAHINYDLPLTLAAIGLVTEDGQSRKADHDQVNVFLNRVMEPLLAELAARFDSNTVNIVTPFGVGYTALFQQVALWRETAFRFAEQLSVAATPEQRALVMEAIELNAVLEANVIVTAYGYLPPLITAQPRDRYCQSRHGVAPPLPYAFGTPSAY